MSGKISALGLALGLAACTASAEPVTEASPASAPAAAMIAADQQAFLQTCEDWDEWDKPAPPFEVYRNTYYVGTCGIAVILIANDSGHILIDSGTEAGADVVMTNIGALGFDIKDVRFLLSTHEHFDHVGGMAKLQQASGAKVVASKAAAPVLSSGQTAADDPQAGMHDPFPAVRVDALIADGGTIQSGDMAVRAIATPGHSPGGLSWAWQECKERCENIVYADSLSPVSSDEYKFSEHPAYLADYLAGLWRLIREDCQILLSPHPSHSQMLKRMAAGKLIENGPGDKPCARYANGKIADITARLAKEAATQ